MLLLLSGCGGLEARNLTIHVHPAILADPSCVGVVGFELIFDSSGKLFSNVFLNAGPVLDPSACRLDVSNVPKGQSNSWTSVLVLGKDGAGTVLVRGSQRIDNLPGSDVDVPLRAAVPQEPVLVVGRTQLLNGAALSDTTRMVVTAPGRSAPLVDVSRSGAGTYFDVEPAAYTVSSANLGLQATDDNMPLTVALITAQSVTTTTVRAIWAPTGDYYEAK